MAARAPRLTDAVAASANDLQRAAWACEAGAPALAAASDATKTGQVRYFLAAAGVAAADEPPLVLTPGHLVGVGLLSDDLGWSVIRFRCTLASDLRQAKVFTFSILARAKTPVGDPTSSASLREAARPAKNWNTELKRATLSYGVPHTEDIDFWAECRTGVGSVSLQMGRTVDWLKKDGYVVLTLGEGSRSGLYVARGALDEEAGSYMPAVTISPGDSLFEWLTTGTTLSIDVGGDLAYTLPLKGAAAPAQAFAAACRR